MSTEVRWRKGTTAEHASFTGALAEVTVDTDLKALRVHDNTTPGGNRTLMISERSAVNGVASLDAAGQVPASQLGNAISSSSFLSVAAAQAATIPATTKRIKTEFYAPNFIAPKTLAGGASYRRISFTLLSGFPAASYFRSTDRFMPDGSTHNTNGGYWLLDERRPNVQMTGALGDGTTDDTVAINAALSYMSLMGGGEVDIFPTGAAYRTTASLIAGNGTALVGSATTTFPGTTAPKADWVKYGTWINPTHATQSGVILQGHGSALRGVCFWHDQPIPTGGAYTPNTYGWAIDVQASHTTVEDIVLANARHGIIYNYTTGSGGGTAVSLRNVIASCLGTCLNTTNVNDTMHIENFHARPIWQTQEILTMYFVHSTAWDCGYTDNVIVNGFEMVFLSRGVYFRNQTCLGNTHSLYNAQISGLQLSLCRVGMQVENANAVVTGQINDLVVQQGNMFGFTWSDECMTLNSDFVDLQIGSLRVNEAGGSVMTLGHGVGGRMQVANLDVRSYSSVSAGQTAIAMAANSQLRLGTYRIIKPAAAGNRFAGAGMDAGLITGKYEVACSPYGRFSEVDVTASSAGWADLSTDCPYRPGVSSAHQIRLIGDINVITSQAGTSMQLRFSGISVTETATASTASTGWKSFDTGWIDIPEAAITGLSSLGRLQANLGSNVRIQNGAVNLLVR